MTYLVHESRESRDRLNEHEKNDETCVLKVMD